MRPNPLHVLVVDDEPPIRKLLRAGLGTQDYKVSDVENARQAYDQLQIEKPDLIILDLGLPDRNGLDLLRQLRNEGVDVPVIVLSSRTDEKGIVQALEIGADDYVTKPFGMNELIARIQVALRHRLQEQGERPVFKVGDLTVDLVHRLVTVEGKEVKLSPREYGILRTLVQHAGKVLTHQSIIQDVWGAATDVQNLRVHVRQVRQKIEPEPEQPQYLLTETGVGYRLRAPDR